MCRSTIRYGHQHCGSTVSRRSSRAVRSPPHWTPARRWGCWRTVSPTLSSFSKRSAKRSPHDGPASSSHAGTRATPRPSPTTPCSARSKPMRRWSPPTGIGELRPAPCVTASIWLAETSRRSPSSPRVPGPGRLHRHLVRHARHPAGTAPSPCGGHRD